MKVLVTGGAGFIGAALCARLLSQDETEAICAVDNLDAYYDPAIKRKRLEGLMTDPRFSWVRADIRDREAMQDVMKRQAWDAVVHLAAIPGVRPSLENPALYADVDVTGTVTVLQEAARVNVRRFVFASSSSVYGEQPFRPLKEEDIRETPESPYAAAKWAGEAFARTFQRLYGMAVTSLRFFTVYGPSQRPDMAIHRFATLLAAGEPLPVYQPDSCRDYTYIDDVVDGVIRSLTSPSEETYRVYNIGSGRPIRLMEMVETLGRTMGVVPKIRMLGAQTGDVSHTWADISRAKRELGYEPSVSFEEGIRRFVDWFRKEERV
ncbi:epimerase [Polycladomyces abyssicola]|uniref:Epimerase n=1 Tax=Polycladomyces abyssicola TaxID=1125966 RepID=A0A8D5ZMG4_9BACL|nr:NAD-dependent epimerase/dehydratase family protein [Polycladomyces abyssicola]BCU80268.1 epimerase [Polycladomyces abyssicola]